MEDNRTLDRSRHRDKLAPPQPEGNHQTKKACIRSSTEPEVTIVVGGKEFLECKQAIRRWSGYFDAAFRSGMKETNSLRFEFPDRDPKEWELIVSLSHPCSADKITEENFSTVLSWYDELSSVQGLEACDNFLLSEVLCNLPLRGLPLRGYATLGGNPTKRLPGMPFGKFDRGVLAKVLDLLGTSLQCGLEESQKFCFRVVACAVAHLPSLFGLEECSQLVSLVKQHSDCRRELWGAIEERLPASVLDMGRDDLLKQKLLANLIHSEIVRVGHLKKEERQEKKLEEEELKLARSEKKLQKKGKQLNQMRGQLTQHKRVLEILKDPSIIDPSNMYVRRLYEELARDPICRDLCPQNWSVLEQ